MPSKRIPIFHWLVLLGRSYLGKSLSDEAISAYQKAVDFSGSSIDLLLNLAYGYSVTGMEEKALEIIEELDHLPEHKYIPNYQMAAVYAGLKEKDKAFEYLELAYKDRDPDLVYLKLTFPFDDLRSDPRFDAMLNKLNLE